MKIAVLALEGVFDTGLSAILDALTTANELAAMLGWSAAPFELRVLGLCPEVHTSQGLRVPVQAIDPGWSPDWVAIPAIGYKMPDALQQALMRPDIAAAAQALRSWADGGAKIAAACIGTFVLAESGLLNTREATTTWWLAPLFRQRYPEVRLNSSRMIVDAGSVVTAGAALGHMDLALWLIRQASPELASMAARYLIVDSRPAQSTYAIVDHLAHADPLVRRFEVWARARLAQGFDLDAAVRELGTSKRTLARRIREVLGKTPLSYFQDIRVERAVHLLKTGNDSIERIAMEVGYADGVTLRTLLRRRLGRGVRELRGRD